MPFKDLMIVGIDVYHDASRKGSSFAGVVSSMNDLATRYYSMVKEQKQGINSHVCTNLFYRFFHQFLNGAVEKENKLIISPKQFLSSPSACLTSVASKNTDK